MSGYCQAAGINPDPLGKRGTSTHSLRKTAGHDAIRNGAEMHQLREFAGHSDIRPTDAEMAAWRIQIRAPGRQCPFTRAILRQGRVTRLQAPDDLGRSSNIVDSARLRLPSVARAVCFVQCLEALSQLGCMDTKREPEERSVIFVARLEIMKSPARFLLCIVSLSALLFANSNGVFGQDESVGQLVKQLPPGANSLMIVDVGKIQNSDLAIKENWFDSHSAEVASGMHFLPDDTKLVAIASQMEYQLLMPTWTIGFLMSETAPSLDSVSQQVNGSIDVVAGRDVALSQSDMFVFSLNKQTIATYSPATRQNFATWLSQLDEGRSSFVSEGLIRAVAAAESGSPFVIAFDMKDVVGSGSLIERAQGSRLLKEKNIDPRTFSDRVASIRSVLFTADIGRSITARIDIEFAQNVEILAPVAKQLIQEITDNHGIHIPGFESWQASVRSNHVTVRGDFSKTGLRKVISILDSPEPHMTSSAVTSAGADSVGSATRRYYDAISSMITELQNDIGTGGDSLWKYQRWMKSYSTKVANLEMRNVDRDMLDFGSFVAQTFDNISLQITSTHETTDVRNSNLMAYGSGSPAARYRRYGYYGYGYGYGSYRYGYRGYRAAANAQTQAERRAIRRQGRSNAFEFGADSFTSIKSRERDIHRIMLEKYSDDFE